MDMLEDDSIEKPLCLKYDNEVPSAPILTKPRVTIELPHEEENHNSVHYESRLQQQRRESVAYVIGGKYHQHQSSLKGSVVNCKSKSK